MIPLNPGVRACGCGPGPILPCGSLDIWRLDPLAAAVLPEYLRSSRPFAKNVDVVVVTFASIVTEAAIKFARGIGKMSTFSSNTKRKRDRHHPALVELAETSGRDHILQGDRLFELY